MTTPIRLTQFSHGGGCGCKIAPGLLTEILKGGSRLPVPPELLVGIETSDDAAVYKLNDEQALIATTDFFMPIVDDPYDFGRIAATNAISDVYAMGGRPIMALALVGMPINVLPAEVIARILEGGESVCRAAGIPIAGGHSIDSAEPIYGLVALGLVHPKLVKRNADALAGDRIILPGVHAMTDVTGFGLAGHALELARGAHCSLNLEWSRVPLIDGVEALAEKGIVTGASGRNFASYGHDIALPADFATEAKALLTDPQTSGGLLVSCSADSVAAVLDIFRKHGFASATEIGTVGPRSGALLTVR
jgi:selenide,water dikinase